MSFIPIEPWVLQTIYFATMEPPKSVFLTVHPSTRSRRANIRPVRGLHCRTGQLRGACAVRSV